MTSKISPTPPTPPNDTAPPPIVAHAVETRVRQESDIGWLAMFSVQERPYIRNMKKRERTTIFKNLERGIKDSRYGEAPLRVQVLQSKLPNNLQLQIFEMLRGSHCSEKYVAWVKKAIELPLMVEVRPRLKMDTARKVLDSTIAGHTTAKIEVMKMVCQSISGGTNAGAYSLALEGPPGTGKTYFIRNAMAKALARPFISIPMGGATDISFLLGHNYTYEGSKSGRLVDALIEAKCCNPIIHFDEPDKVGERGRELLDFLVHLIDPTQNTQLRDRYLHGIDIDYSKCTFVFSFNDASKIPPILLDRMKRIHMGAPSDEQKKEIVVNHIIPRVHNRINYREVLSPECIEHIISRNTREGMRDIEKQIDHILALGQLENKKGSDMNLKFVEEALNIYEEAEKTFSLPPPPPNMYT